MFYILDFNNKYHSIYRHIIIMSMYMIRNYFRSRSRFYEIFELFNAMSVNKVIYSKFSNAALFSVTLVWSSIFNYST